MDFFDRQKKIINKENQDRLKETSVLIAGVGGLGTSVAQQLVRLGVGTLFLVDNGILDAPDLNRQILYTKKDIGKAKVDIAKKNLLQIGLGTEIIKYKTKIAENFDLSDRIDFVIDCLDNFEARYYLDDFVFKKKIPMIHGGIHGLFGQVTTIIPNKTKSLRKIFNNSIPELNEKIPVISSIPSLIASVQVIEFVKIFCDYPNTLINKILKIDLNDYSLDIFDLI